MPLILVQSKNGIPEQHTCEYDCFAGTGTFPGSQNGLGNPFRGANKCDAERP